MSGSFRYYDLVTATFITVLMCSNLFGPAKIAQAEMPVIGAYVFGDVAQGGRHRAGTLVAGYPA